MSEVMTKVKNTTDYVIEVTTTVDSYCIPGKTVHNIPGKLLECPPGIMVIEAAKTGNSPFVPNQL